PTGTRNGAQIGPVPDSTFDHNALAITAGSGTLMVSNSVFTANGTGIAGGGMVTVTDCSFAGNTAMSSGGAINTGGSLTAANCTFSGNSAGGNGGALFVAGPTAGSKRTFVGNSAGSNGAGGAIDATASNGLTVINSTFSGNAAGMGGAIRAETPFVGLDKVINTIFAGSTSGGNCNGNVTDGGH